MRYWNYGKTENTLCGMVICTKAGGDFQEGDIYPFYYRNGYPYIVLINIDEFNTSIFRMDCYGCKGADDYYQIIGYTPSWEDAEFKEVVI